MGAFIYTPARRRGCPSSPLPAEGRWETPWDARVTVKKGRVASGLSILLTFYLQNEVFESGRCWDRTSVLCRVKAVRYFAGTCRIAAKSHIFAKMLFPTFQDIHPGCC